MWAVAGHGPQWAVGCLQFSPAAGLGAAELSPAEQSGHQSVSCWDVVATSKWGTGAETRAFQFVHFSTHDQGQTGRRVGTGS